MEKAKVYLFTSPTCPHCPSAKKFAEEFKKTRDDFQLIDMSMATREGEKAAKKYDVMSVPTFIIKGSGYPGRIGLAGMQSNESMNKYLDIALGIKSLEDFKKTTFGERIKSWIKI